MPQQGPGDPGQLVGEGDNDDIVMGPHHPRFRPSAQRRVALSDIRQRRARSVDQLSAKVAVAPLADAEQLRFAAGGELPRDNAKPGRKITTSIKGLRSPDRSDKRGRDDRAEPGDCGKSPSVFILLHLADELRVEGRNPSIELGPLSASIGDQNDHSRAQSRSALLIHQRREELLKLPPALRSDKAAL